MQAREFLGQHSTEELPIWNAHAMPVGADIEGANTQSVYCTTKTNGLRGDYVSKAHAKFKQILEAKFDEFVTTKTWTPAKLPSSILYAVYIACRLVSSLRSHLLCESTDTEVSKHRLNLLRLVAV